MILDKIIADKKPEVEARKNIASLEQVMCCAKDAPPALDFAAALRRPSPADGIRMIAEVKKASPSKGLIRAEFDPVAIARAYERSGASGISVLTDEKYFQGHLDYLKAVRRAVGIPLLRKDFIIDPYQIYEARAAGADAILLIAAVLSRERISEFMGIAAGIGMVSLVETHTADEMESALSAGAKVIGINNRDLQTFETTLSATLTLAKMVSDGCILVSESGISTRDDVKMLQDAGVDAILVGESLMRESDPSMKVKELLGTG